jgi:hypothetical protein
MPRIFFWLGQISTHTLKSMIVPSHAPMPIGTSALSLKKSASSISPPSIIAPASHVTTAAQRKIVERARRHVLGDAGAGGRRVGGGGLEGVDLHEVEVVEQPDPHHARHDVHPAPDPVLDEVGGHVMLPVMARAR